jgi:hypothetical protein
MRIHWTKWHVPPLLRAIAIPFTMVRKRFSQCLRFLFLNLVFGLLGVNVALLVPIFFVSYSFPAQFEASLRAGAFYTFTIAFLSSTAVLLLESQPRRPDTLVAQLKPTLVLIVLALVVFSAIGAVMQMWLESSRTPSNLSSLSSASAYAFQTRLFWAGVVVSFYCFLVATYEEDLDDFAAADDARRSELNRGASAADSDGRGISV